MGRRLSVLLNGVPAGAYPRMAPQALRGRVRPIVRVGAEVLRRPCTPVAECAFGTPELSGLVDAMFATMYAADGMGLTANQIGETLRVFVYDCTDEGGVRHVGHVINPVAEPGPKSRRRSVRDEEGCLSVPGVYQVVHRPHALLVSGTDLTGAPVQVMTNGYAARCLSHELDHLDGVLYLDLLPKRAGWRRCGR
ncbi:peptide deformylase [Streptomyces sp. NPDC096311]|uniref:peptide deformylase n=1 Tax=Streptomyces sp. NPDC096311 TaxID=3366083 RepID=UPI0037FBE739